MADEITYSASLSYTKGNVVAFSRAITGLGIDVSGSRFIHHTQQIGTSEEAIDIGELASLGVAVFKNLDASNFIQLKTATSGTLMVKLLPGEMWPFRFGSGITAPFAIADTAACYMEYVIWET